MLSSVEENADGWGPSTVPEHLKDVPFAPFGKGDKLGKASDWTQAAYQKYSGACRGLPNAWDGSLAAEI